MKKHNYKKIKSIWKPNFTPVIKEAKLVFAIKYKN